MAALPYMQLYVADYLSDTAHLSAIQHGGYLLLLFNYWQRGRPLSNANDRLANVARMSNDEWAENKASIAEFFVIDGDEWRHTRIDRDLAAVAEKSGKAASSGKASASSRAGKTTNAERTFNERSTNAERTFNHKDVDVDVDKDQKQSQKQTPAPQAIPGVNAQPEAPTAAASPLSATAEFDEAMTEYPKRPGISRPSALRAWKARIKAGANPAQMLDGVRRYAAFCRTTGVEPRFVKAPETFFGPGEHYLADWSHEARAGPASIVSSKQERIENYWKQANAKGGYGECSSSERDITGESERIA